MLVGLGVDIVSNNRIENLINKWEERFINKVFTDGERDFNNKSENKNQRYAANYAVKEAFVKALGTGFKSGIKFHNIEVKRDTSGKPYVKALGDTKLLIKEKGISKIHTTISHEKQYSVAIVIFEA